MAEERGIPRILRVDAIRVAQGDWRGRDLLDDTGRKIGFAHKGYVYDLDRQAVVFVSPSRGFGWEVHDHRERFVGSLVPPVLPNRRGKLKAVRQDKEPARWSGWVRLGRDRDVAYVADGQLVRHPEGSVVASVFVGDVPLWFQNRSKWADWTLRFHEEVELPLKLMCFGWFRLIWHLQWVRDTSD